MSAGDTRSHDHLDAALVVSRSVQTLWSPTFVFAAACPFLPPVALSRTSDTAPQIASIVETTAPVPSRGRLQFSLYPKRHCRVESLAESRSPLCRVPLFCKPSVVCTFCLWPSFSLSSLGLSLRKEFPERPSTVDSSSFESGPLWELDLALLGHDGALLRPLRRLALCGCSYFPVLH